LIRASGPIQIVRRASKPCGALCCWPRQRSLERSRMACSTDQQVERPASESSVNQGCHQLRTLRVGLAISESRPQEHCHLSAGFHQHPNDGCDQKRFHLCALSLLRMVVGGKLWPYQMPVVRPKVAARDGVSRESLNCMAAFSRNWALTARPVRNHRLRSLEIERQSRCCPSPVAPKELMQTFRHADTLA